MENISMLLMEFYSKYEIVILYLLALISGIGVLICWQFLKVAWRIHKAPAQMRYSSEVK